MKTFAKTTSYPDSQETVLNAVPRASKPECQPKVYHTPQSLKPVAYHIKTSLLYSAPYVHLGSGNTGLRFANMICLDDCVYVRSSPNSSAHSQSAPPLQGGGKLPLGTLTVTVHNASGLLAAPSTENSLLSAVGYKTLTDDPFVKVGSLFRFGFDVHRNLFDFRPIFLVSLER